MWDHPAGILNVVESVALSFVLGSVGGAVIRRYGPRWGFVDRPNPRSSHRVPQPKGGGVGILAAFVVAAVCWKTPFPLWASAAIVAIVSLGDDARNLSFKPRLWVQLACAFLASMGRWYPSLGPDLVTVQFVALILVSTLFVTAVANWYNFMDGVDGIAGVTGAIAFACLGLFGMAEGRAESWTIVPFCVSSACAGFLLHNLPKARVFMGDVGSILLGFVFAAWVLYASRSLEQSILYGSLLLPFYCDEGNTMLARIRGGEVLTRAHRRHVYQILANQARVPHLAVTSIYAAVEVGVALLAWTVRGDLALLAGTLASVALALFLAGQQVRHRWERS